MSGTEPRPELTPAEFELLVRTTHLARDRAILRLLYELMLKPSQVIALDWPRDIDFEHSALIVPAGRRPYLSDETVFLPPTVEREIKAWLRERGPLRGPLFFAFDNANQARDPLSRGSINRIVRASGRRVDRADLTARSLWANAWQQSEARQVANWRKLRQEGRQGVFWGALKETLSRKQRLRHHNASTAMYPGTEIYWAGKYLSFSGAPTGGYALRDDLRELQRAYDIRLLISCLTPAEEA